MPAQRPHTPACSSGNHGAALALAARIRGVPATVIVPRTTPTCKVAAIEAYGARVVYCDPSMDAREAAMQAELGAHAAGAQPTFVPPYNGAATIAGQGTIALELLQQLRSPRSAELGGSGPLRRDAQPDGADGRSTSAAAAPESADAQPALDAIIVPVSGGGMIAGIATVIKARLPACKVSDPAWAPLLARRAAGLCATEAPPRLLSAARIASLWIARLAGAGIGAGPATPPLP